jgi:hypothetical protein
MAGFGDMMKQAREMQERLKEVQAAVAAMEVTGESGAGLVRITMTGRHDVRAVEIDASLLSEDKSVLEDLVAAAVNDANRRVEREQQEKMAELAQGLPLPPGLKLF